MTPRAIPCFFVILILATSLIAGCAQEEPVAAPPTPTPTPTPSPTPVPTPTLSPACSDLLAAADTDAAFLQFLSNNSMYSRVSALATTDCRVGAASQRNEMIARGPKPKTPALADARKYLMDASAYCLDPEAGTAKSRTRDDVETYVAKMSGYTDLVYSCTGGFDQNTSTLLQNSLEVDGAKVFRGSGDLTDIFMVKNAGKRTFTMTYTGEGNFSALLKDPAGKTLVLHDRTVRAWTGEATVKMDTGNYQLTVGAEGPWTITTFIP